MRITRIFEYEGSVWVWFSYRTPCSDHDCSLRISEGDESAFGSRWKYDAETAAREFSEFLPEIMAAVNDWVKEVNDISNQFQEHSMVFNEAIKEGVQNGE